MKSSKPTGQRYKELNPKEKFELEVAVSGIYIVLVMIWVKGYRIVISK